MKTSNPFQSLIPIFRPPFNGLWLIVLLYYAWCYAVYPYSPILRGDLPDTDDYMYLNQVLDWMRGQGWYDNVQHRLDPPPDGGMGGVPIHFSRFAQLPMAGIIYVIELLGLGPKGAATLMAAFYPLALLGVLFMALRWLAESFVPKDWTGVTAFIALFATGTMFLFQPGHIDHHGLDVILITLTLGCALRMIERPDQYRWGLYGGLVMALALTVALEVLPWLLIISGWLGLWATSKGGTAARNGLAYALALYLGSFVTLTLTRPPSDFLTLDVLSYSLVYVILTGGIAVAFAGIGLTANGPALLRWVVGAGLAGLTGFLFLQRFPDLISGPYGGIDPALAQIILGEINEAQPYKLPGNSWFMVSQVIAAPCIALVAGLYFLKRARDDQRWGWGLIVLMLAAAMSLTVFYQRRFIGTMEMAMIVPLTVLLHQAWAAIGARWRGRPRVYAEIGLLFLVGPLPGVLYPALLDGRNFNIGVLLFPAYASHASASCDMYKLENILRDPVYYGDRPRLIMSTIGSGPELLFRTQHTVLSAPYHMDVEGNVDATRFFSTPYPEEAEGIARRRHVDLVVTCRYIPEFYLRPTLSKMFAKNDTLKDFSPHFISRLMSGKTPQWLKTEAHVPLAQGREGIPPFSFPTGLCNDALPPGSVAPKDRTGQRRERGMQQRSF